jgi:hypothetical protein
VLHDPLGSTEMLFQVTADGLLLPSEGSDVQPCLIQCLACGSHDSDESLLLSMHGSDGGLSCGHDRDVVLLPLGGGGSGGLLPVDGGEVGVAAQYGRQDGGG